MGHLQFGACSDLSAVAYYFGRDLQQELDVPIGLIHTSWWLLGRSMDESGHTAVHG